MNPPRGQAERAPRRKIDGVVLVDKPSGLTSNAVLQHVKRAYRAQKAGHTGTLDPLASGLLPICLGEATKFSSFFTDSAKRYRALIHLGVQTETGDCEGAVIATQEVVADRAAIDRALTDFRGNILQTPHRYSALKRDGRPLYSYARAGVEVAIAPRAVRIDRLVIETWDMPFLTVDVACSKGTYIRSLAEDIGATLGCGAHVAALRRTEVSGLHVHDAIGLDALEALDDGGREGVLNPVTLLVKTLVRIDLPRIDGERFLHGQQVRIAFGSATHGATVAVHQSGRSVNGGFLGVAKVHGEDGSAWLIPSRVVASF